MAYMFSAAQNSPQLPIVGESSNKKRKVLSEAERTQAKIAKDEANQDLHEALSKYLLSRTKDHVGPRLTVYQLCKEHTKVSITTMNRKVRELCIGQDDVLTEQDIQEKLKNIEFKSAGRRPDLDAETLMALQETAQNIDVQQPDHIKQQILQDAILVARKAHAQSRGYNYRAANMKEFCPSKFRQYAKVIAPEMDFARAPRAASSRQRSSSSSANAANNAYSDYHSDSSSSSNSSFGFHGTTNAASNHTHSTSTSSSSNQKNANTKKSSQASKAPSNSSGSTSISGTTHGSITRVPAIVNTTTIGTQTLSKAPSGSVSAGRKNKQQAKTQKKKW